MQFWAETAVFRAKTVLRLGEAFHILAPTGLGGEKPSGLMCLRARGLYNARVPASWVKPEPFLFTNRRVPPSPPTRLTLLDWLAARYPAAKRQTLRRMLQAGRVTINGRRVVSAARPVAAEDSVVVTDEPQRPVTARERQARPAPDAKLDIVYEDTDVLVVDKPAGVLTSTVPRERRPTLLAMVRAHVEDDTARSGPPRVGLIHRLDRDASGLLVFSKTHEAYMALKKQFFHHSVERVYTAVAEGVPTPRSGRVDSRLIERADGTVYSTREPGKGERAITDYEVVDERKRRSLLRVKLHTGRKHQIRVHLSERGSPIVGDRMYGTPKARTRPPRRPANESRPPERLMLAATRLAFVHPRTGEPMTFERPTPRAFLDALDEAPPRNR